MDETPIGRAVQQSMELELACVLCGRLTRSRGGFMPEDRAVIYALCDEHPHDATTAEAVEAALQKQGYPGNH